MSKRSLRVVLGYLLMACAVGPAAAVSTEPGPNPAGPAFASKRVIEHGMKTVSGPALQVDDSGVIHLAWIDEEKEERNLQYLKIPGEATAPAEPVRVTTPAEPVAAVHQAPGLALGPDGGVYVTWSSPHPRAEGKPFTSLLRLSRSTDGGRSFAPPVTVNDDQVATNHSFDNLAVAPDGTVHIAWIDAREGKKEPGTFTARSTDHGRTVAKNVKIDDNTCVCCRLAVATAHDGTVYLAWRKVFDGSVREMVVARSTDGGQSFSDPVIVGHDRWVFPACPHRPGSIGVDQQGRLYIVWYTEGADETPTIYLAISDDGGRTFSPKQALNSSKGTFPDRPQMAVDGEGRVVVVWEEQSPVRREVVMSYSLDRGQTFSRPQKLTDRRAQSPAVSLNSQGLVGLAWMEHVPPGRRHRTVVQTVQLPSLE